MNRLCEDDLDLNEITGFDGVDAASNASALTDEPPLNGLMEDGATLGSFGVSKEKRPKYWDRALVDADGKMEASPDDEDDDAEGSPADIADDVLEQVIDEEVEA